MIPAHWSPHHRDDDGELVGYLAPADDGLVVPMTLLGTVAGEATTELGAESLLDGIGLSYLAEQWWLREDDGSERRVVLLEVDAERVVVGHAEAAMAVGRPRDLGERTAVPIPTDRLRRV